MLEEQQRGTGFRAIEAAIVLAALLALSALLVPAVRGAKVGSKVAQVLDTLERVESACCSYREDLGSYAYEYCGSYFSQYPQHRQLTATQPERDWNGPYLDQPLDRSNPWPGSVHLYRYLLVQGLTAWDLDLDGTAELVGQESANVLWLSSVPERDAEDLDAAIDPTPKGDVDWRTSGRVQWRPNQYLWILVHRL